MTAETCQLDDLVDYSQIAIQDVFQTMLSLPVEPAPVAALAADPEGEVVSSVGFSGQATGAVYLYARVSCARLLTSRMLGIDESEIDNGEMINDALGELSNMIAGYVKSRLCDRGMACHLTIPSIIRGHDLSVERPSLVSARLIGLSCAGHRMLAEIFLKDS